MTEQLALVDVPAIEKPKVEPKPRPLKPRQLAALSSIAHAGPDGLTTDEIGALLHEWRGRTERGYHHRDDRCLYCGKTGREVALSIRADSSATAPGSSRCGNSANSQRLRTTAPCCPA